MADDFDLKPGGGLHQTLPVLCVQFGEDWTNDSHATDLGSWTLLGVVLGDKECCSSGQTPCEQTLHPVN